MRTITEDEFYEKFHPIGNHIVDGAPFDGCMFETYGEELDYINKVTPNNRKNIWTILENEGKLYISSGYHFVNRMGYLITEEEHDDDIEVNLEGVPDEEE